MSQFGILWNTAKLLFIWGFRQVAKIFRHTRSETIFVIPQYDATNYILSAYGVTDIGFMETMNFGRDDPEYETGDKKDIVGDSYGLATKLSLQHYHCIATGGEQNLSLKGLRVLEVGCGRGGGSHFVAEKLQPAELVAVDLSAEGIEVCKKKYKNTSNLKFQVADAQNLPFEDNSFDMLLNVESSHCYPKIGEFLKEVSRVLKPGGIFCYADISTPKYVEQLEHFLPKTLGLNIISKENVSKHAMGSLDKVSVLRSAAVSKFPFFIRPILKNFVGTPDSESYKNFRSSDWTYIRFACQKKK